jgi:AcrR family transcriptional regulator
MAADATRRVTADDLLEAGWELVREELGWAQEPDKDEGSGDRIPRLMASITPRAVAERRSVTTGAFYRRWRSRELYIDALTSYILDKQRHRSEYVDKVLGSFDDAIASGMSLPDVIRQVARVDLELTAESAAFTVQIHLWSLCRQHEELRTLLQEQYQAIDRAWETKYATVIALLGWRLRPGVSIRTVAAIFSSVAEGMAIRCLVDPASVGQEELALTLMALVTGVIDWDNDDLSVEDRLRSLMAPPHIRGIDDEGSAR